MLTQDPDGGKILLRSTIRRTSIDQDKHPFDISELFSAQEHGSSMGVDVSSWQRRSHSLHSHAHQLDEHTIVSFASDFDAATFYVYDSKQTTLRKYEAAGMRDSARYETAAGHCGTKTIYALTSNSDDETDPPRIISFDLCTMRWKRVAIGGCIVGKILGAVMVLHNLLVLSNKGYWTYSVTSDKLSRLGKCDDLPFLLSKTTEVNLFYLHNTQEVLLVVHGQGMCTLDLYASAMGNPCNKREVMVMGIRRIQMSALAGFGCLVTSDCAHVLMFTRAGRIWVIDTATWKARASRAKCPTGSNSQPAAAMFAWIIGDARQQTQLVHVFMRGNGYHWAMPLQPILNRD